MYQSKHKGRFLLVLPDTKNSVLHMRRICRKILRHWRQLKPKVKWFQHALQHVRGPYLVSGPWIAQTDKSAMYTSQAFEWQKAIEYG